MSTSSSNYHFPEKTSCRFSARLFEHTTIERRSVIFHSGMHKS